MNRIFISWTAPASRTDLLVDTFKAESYHVSYFLKNDLLYKLIRYVFATFETIYLLFNKKPKIVFLINQPVFLPMVVYICSRLRKFHYVIDSHSGLFNKRIWSFFIPIMKIIYRHSCLNIAHNNHDADIYKSWGVKTMVLGTEFYSDINSKNVDLATTKNIVVIGIFAPDEPIPEILQAAPDLPDVNFYITGPIDNAKKRGIIKWPKNVTLTDFLPRENFLGLVKSSDAAMILVETDNTMQRGAWEAMACGTPLIISDWEILRDTFPRGAIYVDNSKSSIIDGVRAFFDNIEQLKMEIINLRDEKGSLWNSEVDNVMYFIDSLELSSVKNKRSYSFSHESI